MRVTLYFSKSPVLQHKYIPERERERERERESFKNTLGFLEVCTQNYILKELGGGHHSKFQFQ